MSRPWLTSMRVMAALALAGCPSTDRPEPPAIARDVALVDDAAEYTHPQVPGHRTTMDGRVAVRVQGGPRTISFWLFVPEKLGQPILSGPPGPEILAEASPLEVPLPAGMLPGVTTVGHHAICDPTGEFPGPGERPNPYACGDAQAHDCYDFTIVSTTSQSFLGIQFWGTPVHVEVAAPKTRDARLARVELGEPVAGAVVPLSTEWTEPAITQDGRLLTGRFGGAPRAWTNPVTGETLVRFYDLGYSVLSPDAAPCDVRGWTQFNPMSHAPFDPAMVGTYGLAAYPFRDSEGAPIPDGEDMGGSYPWVDREGTNVFMTGVPGRLSETSQTLFPHECWWPGCERYPEPVDWDRGFLVAGLWTHGKLVHLDGLINNSDWAVGVAAATHQRVKLYRDAGGADVAVRFGAGRASGAEGGADSPSPRGYSGNANILDSLQNLPNHHFDATPITPRDVVWIMGTGVGTDEIAFDDYVDPNAFIVSNMQGSVTQHRNERGETLGVPHYWNGQVRTLLVPIRLPPDVLILVPDLAEEVHVQNAATSLGWQVPPFGRVAAGSGRIEPVALGGIEGNGSWLDGTDGIVYPVPAHSRSILDVPWYVGLFVDARANGGDARVLVTFPDGSALRLAGTERLEYVAGGAVVHTVQVPAREVGERWLHLGLGLAAGNRVVTLLVDGFAFDRFESSSPLFTVGEGELVVGAAGPGVAGFRGWVDDFKVLAHDVNPEVACNHAEGTLLGLRGNARWESIAARYPGWAHGETAALVGEGSDARFACFHDYARDFGAHVANLPEGTVSERRRINFPEGPLRAGAPRPDSSRNPFCLTCHTPHGQGGLSEAALAYDAATLAEDDPRRQPMQPPRRVFGNVPAGWIAPGPGAGGPAQATVAPPDGLLVDRWVLPGAADPRAPAADGRFVHRH
ncbi:MAG: hypothetical protein IPK07_08630 [Deltaproteobacteria bacterium]|nr:hypothetical protein [Deltaproteobacteria bacterium]